MDKNITKSKNMSHSEAGKRTIGGRVFMYKVSWCRFVYPNVFSSAGLLASIYILAFIWTDIDPRRKYFCFRLKFNVLRNCD